MKRFTRTASIIKSLNTTNRQQMCLIYQVPWEKGSPRTKIKKDSWDPVNCGSDHSLYEGVRYTPNWRQSISIGKVTPVRKGYTKIYPWRQAISIGNLIFPVDRDSSHSAARLSPSKRKIPLPGRYLWQRRRKMSRQESGDVKPQGRNNCCRSSGPVDVASVLMGFNGDLMVI